jgi:DNA-binding NarL/FixJ family response regulator
VVNLSRDLIVKAHSGLCFMLDTYRHHWSAVGVNLDFTDPGALFVLPPDGMPVLIPAASEPDITLVRSLRREDCLRPIIAVVNDLDGHQTFRAIDNGASGVLNVRLPAEMQVGAVLAACDGLVRRASVGARPQLAGGAVCVLERDGEVPAAPEETSRLVRLLCGTGSISSIAQQFYCSERSMYRRLRRLYEQMGVSGRSELRSHMTDQNAMLVPTYRPSRN